MPRSYPPEFRRKVLDLLKAGRKIAEIAHDMQISEQTIYAWRQQEQVDASQVPADLGGEGRSSPRPGGGLPNWRSSWRSTSVPASC